MDEKENIVMELNTRQKKKTLDRTMSLDNRQLSELERSDSFDPYGVYLDPLLPQHLWAHGQHMLQKSRTGSNKGQCQMKGRVMYKKFLVLSNIKRKSWPFLASGRTG